MPRARRIDVLVAEASDASRAALATLLEGDARLRVVATIGDGAAVVEAVARHRPDVILMDIRLPTVDGFEATRRLMEAQPLPIVVCSATSDVQDTAVAVRALEAGALACVARPTGSGSPEDEARVARLRETVWLMAEVKVVRRRPGLSARVQERRRAGGAPVVGIGASTGGPPVLQLILSELPPDFPAPILVVQHIAQGFVAGMVQWLAETSRLPVSIASAGTLARPGHVYLAPDDFHLGLGSDGELILSPEAPEHHVRPAVSFLFRSLAAVCGRQAVGVLLTGMGRDGAQELRTMKERGAATIAQDEETSVIHGMPGAAIALGAATQVLPADRIAPALVSLVTRTTC